MTSSVIYGTEKTWKSSITGPRALICVDRSRIVGSFSNEVEASLVDHGITVGRTITGKIVGIPHMDDQVRDIWNRK